MEMKQFGAVWNEFFFFLFFLFGLVFSHVIASMIFMLLNPFFKEKGISKIKTSVKTVALVVLAFFASISGYIFISVGLDLVHFYTPFNA